MNPQFLELCQLSRCYVTTSLDYTHAEMEEKSHNYLGGSAEFSVLESTDLDEYLLLQPGGWDMQITQLTQGAFSSHLRILGLDGLCVYENLWSNACVVQGQSPAGWLMIGGVPNPEEAPVTWCGVRTDRRHFAVTAGGEEVDFWVADGSTDIVVLIDPSLLKKTAGELALDSMLSAKNLDFGDAGSNLIDLALSMLEACEAEPVLVQRPAIAARARSNLLRILEDCFSAGDGPSGVDLLHSREEWVHRAVQHVADSYGQTTAWEMAQVAGVSQKTLELAFREALNTTPGRYLVLTRLNHAHHALTHAIRTDTTVTDVAMSLGFTHMGRFSSAYSTLFHELPSETLKR
mgnify:FL=1